ncbi:MAG: hypothetical protein AAF723_04840 [Pseudomonadota bacterium]
MSRVAQTVAREKTTFSTPQNSLRKRLERRLDYLREEMLEQQLSMIDIETTFSFKANFNPNQPRWPVGSPWGGRWRPADGSGGPPPTLEEVQRKAKANAIIRRYLEGTAGLPPKQGLARIQQNIKDSLNASIMEQPGESERIRKEFERELRYFEKMNRGIIRLYTALTIEEPEFQWPHLGAYVAPQVRDAMDRINTGRVSAVAMEGMEDFVSGQGRRLPTAPPRDNPIVDFEALITTTFEGQKLIAEDVASLGVAYSKYGAAAMRDIYETDTTLWKVFDAQDKADTALAKGDSEASLDFALDAAKELGEYEQTRVQGMYEALDDIAPVGTLNRGVGLFGIGESTNIRIGDQDNVIGIIDAPGPLRGNVSNLDYRIEIADNAFQWMRDNVHGQPANKVTHEVLMGQFQNGELNQFPSAQPPR